MSSRYTSFDRVVGIRTACQPAPNMNISLIR